MSKKTSAIGVFDSGVGGISVLNKLREMMPYEHFMYYGDSKYAPYGEKTRDEIYERCMYICDFFMQNQVKAIVIACNTATSACVNRLRKTYSDIPIIGMEPALKVAAEKTGPQQILVMATSFTLKEEKFAKLMACYDEDNVIYRKPCPKLVEIVEHQELSDEKKVKETLQEYLQPYDLSKLNSIVLGCTHFVFYRKVLKTLLPSHIDIIDGNAGTARHLKEILAERNELNEDGEGSINMFNSMENKHYMELSNSLLDT